jgi:hypothetical protein
MNGVHRKVRSASYRGPPHGGARVTVTFGVALESRSGGFHDNEACASSNGVHRKVISASYRGPPHGGARVTVTFGVALESRSGGFPR